MSEKRSRPPLARMLKIHERMQRNSYPNCFTLAKSLEVSVKTIQRDLEFMRDQLNLPLEYERSKHGYFYTGEVAQFPTVQVTEGEVVALLVAQKALEQYRGTPFEHTLENAFSKMSSGLRDEISFNPTEVMAGFSFRSFGTSKADVKTFETLAKALRLMREVTLEYQKPSSQKAEVRRLQPLHLANIQNLWYVIGFDLEKKDLRQFALPRIKSLKIEETKFERKADFSIEEYLGNSFGAFGGKEMVQVKIQFDSFAAGFIRERSWHSSEQFKEKANGALELSMRVPRLEEVQSWVLSWGSHARVLSPPQLVTAVREAAQAIVQAYRTA